MVEDNMAVLAEIGSPIQTHWRQLGKPLPTGRFLEKVRTQQRPAQKKGKRQIDASLEATRLGLEPRMREPKSLVLPLHHRVRMS